MKTDINASCPMRQILDRIGEKWTALIIIALEDGTLRYTALRRSLGGVTQKVLTQRLRDMERDGLLRRRVHATNPVTTDYTLTPIGRELAVTLRLLRAWALDNAADISVARDAFDMRERRGDVQRVAPGVPYHARESFSAAGRT